MPRIDPLKLLICLSQLLAPNGGIRGSNDVKRLTGLMGKFCKKLVSKCIYIQILKCTETELLGEFMAAGGWTLAYSWLSDGNQTKNWPLVQEILELMLLCPVDVQRLKINAAPKLVKLLSKEGGVEAVRILASKLVEQWLKIVKGETNMDAVGSVQSNAVSAATPDVVVVAGAGAGAANDGGSSGAVSVDTMIDSNYHQHATNTTTSPYTHIPHSNSDQLHPTTADDNDGFVDVDPQALIDECTDAAAVADAEAAAAAAIAMDEHLNGSVELHEVPDDDEEDNDEDDDNDGAENAVINAKQTAGLVFKITMKDGKQVLAKVEGNSPKKVVLNASTSPAGKVLATSSDNSMSRDGVVDEKPISSTKSTEEQRHREKSKSGSGSSSSKDRSKSSSSTSSSKRPSSSSSSSHHRSSNSSNSNHKSSGSRSDKDRHRSSSSKSSSSHRDKSRDKSTSQLAVSQAEKDKETLNKVLATNGPLTKLGKIPKKTSSPPAISATDEASDLSKPSVPAIKRPASISIETRNKDIENRPKTVKLFNSKFRSHGLAEEAPPPPSRRGIKKPTTSPSAPGTVIPSSGGVLGGTAKRRSVSPSAHEADKKARLDLAVASSHVDKPGSIKMISPKPKPSVLMESDMFMDALFAATTSKKDASRKRKRRISICKDAPTSTAASTSPSAASAAIGDQSPTPTKVEKLHGSSSVNNDDDMDADTSNSELPSQSANSDTSTTAAATNITTATATIEASPADDPAAAEPEQPTADVQPVAPVMKFYQDTLDTRRSVTPEPEAEADVAAADATESKANDDNKEDDAAESTENAATSASVVASADKLLPDTPSSPSGETNGDDDNSTGSVAAIKGPGPGCGPDGPPGVLIIHRRRGPKKKLTWRPAGELEDIRYFELDETERCNVTKTPASFGDMKQNERSAERDGFAIARKLSGTDTMTEQMAWSPFLFEVEDVPRHLNGAQSVERTVQQQRELGCLKALYFNRLMVPDTAAEPDFEVSIVQHVEPLVIPLDDVTGNTDAITDFTATPWPDSKGISPAAAAAAAAALPFGQPIVGKPQAPQSMMMHGPHDGGHHQQPPQMPIALQMPPMQQQQPGAPFGGPMAAPYGGGVPNGFAPSAAMMGNNWSTGAAGGMMDGPPPGFMGNGPPPGMMGGPPPMQQQQMGGQFGGGFGGGPFNNNTNNGGGGFNNNDRNGQRWIRHNNNQGNWRGGHMNGGGGGGGPQRPPWANNARTRLCKSFAKGFCRNGDACNFLHPGQNGPMF